MERITLAHLTDLADRLNTVCGLSLHRFVDGIPSPDHYYIRSGYGGYQLVQQSSHGTGCRDCLGGGYDSPRVLRCKLLSFLEGIDLGLEMASVSNDG